MIKLRLGDGRFAIVDDQYKHLRSYNWGVNAWGLVRYNPPRNRRKQQTVYLHRLIMGEPEGRVFHKNRNKLDNRRENLVKASEFPISTIRKIQKNNKSGKSGVTYTAKDRVWMAVIYVNGKRKILGSSFKRKKDAVAARKDAENYYQLPR